MTAGMTGLPQGQELTPRQRWWRRLRYLPLVVLAIASVALLVIGFVTKTSLDRRAEEPAAATIDTGAVSPERAACRPPVDPPATEPWLSGGDDGRRVWDEHAADVAAPYLVGPNGWAFWSDQIDQYASQAVGRTHLSRLDVERWVDHLTALKDGFAAEGVEFYVVVAPSTSSVYPEQLPQWMQSVRGSTIMDQFISAASDLPIVDLRARMIEQKTDDVNLFSWSNSHWTDFGAYAAWRQIAECVNVLYPEGGRLPVPAVDGFDVVGDFNEWASYGFQSPGADWAVPDYVGPLHEVTRTTADGVSETVPGSTTTDASILPVTTTVPDAETGKTALIFRDSMGGGLSSLWQQSYTTTWQFWHRYREGYEDARSYRDYVAEYHPDVVVLELAERHLLNTPPSGTGY